MAAAHKRATKSAHTGKKVFRRYFKHHITGKVYDAWKYGHKGWPIG